MKITPLIVLLLLGATAKAQSENPVSLGRTKDSAMIYLKGSCIYDPASKNQLSFKWFLKTGVTSKIMIISPADSATKVRGLLPGSYQFGFILSDKRLNKADTSYTTVVVQKS